MKELSQEVREFVAIENAKVLPLSARTGFGLDDLRTSLMAALGRKPPPCESPVSLETLEHPRPDALERENPSPVEVTKSEAGALGALPGSETGLSETAEGVDTDDIASIEPPEGAATATVLDYTSSAKTGKLLVRAAMSPSSSPLSSSCARLLLVVVVAAAVGFQPVCELTDSRRKFGGLWYSSRWWCPDTAACVKIKTVGFYGKSDQRLARYKSLAALLLREGVAPFRPTRR